MKSITVMPFLRWTHTDKTRWHATRCRDIRTVQGEKLMALCGGKLVTGWLWDAVPDALPSGHTICAACLALDTAIRAVQDA